MVEKTSSVKEENKLWGSLGKNFSEAMVYMIGMGIFIPGFMTLFSKVFLDIELTTEMRVVLGVLGGVFGLALWNETAEGESNL
jgi:hypothetical protein